MNTLSQQQTVVPMNNFVVRSADCDIVSLSTALSYVFSVPSNCMYSFIFLYIFMALHRPTFYIRSCVMEYLLTAIRTVPLPLQQCVHFILLHISNMQGDGS